MQQILDYLSGKKTYIIAITAAALAFANAMGWAIPEYVWALLGALGLGTLRAAVQKATV
jgi:hypothetical protein